MSLGLVAYGSSDESDTSDTEENEVSSTTAAVAGTSNSTPQTSKSTNLDHQNNSEANEKNEDKDDLKESLPISDDEDYIPSSTGSGGTVVSSSNMITSGFGMRLPPPKQDSGGDMLEMPTSSETNSHRAANTPFSGPDLIDDDLPGKSTTLLTGLPAPKQGGLADMDFNDVLEDEVKPKIYEKVVEAPPKPKPKKRQPVKIAIPSLEDLDSDEEDGPRKKKVKSAGGKNGLFSLLPPPKSQVRKVTNRPLIPHTLSRKPNPPKAPPGGTAKPLPPKPTSSVPSSSKINSRLLGVVEDDSDDDDDEESSSNFFSFGDSSNKLISDKQAEPVNSTEVTSSVSGTNVAGPSPAPAASVEPLLRGPWKGPETTSTLDAQLPPTTSMNAPLSFKNSNSDRSDLSNAPLKFAGASFDVSAGPSSMGPSEGPAMPGQADQYGQYDQQQPDAWMLEQASEENDEYQQMLQDEEFLKIQGKMGRSKDAINIIDVNADDALNPSDLMKNLTEESDTTSYSRKRKDMPSGQQKRKHQITYLAFQAKEREFELKNSWALNKASKRQTQSKYGF